MSSAESARHCLAVLVENEPGVLARVIGLFSGRGYNIESLTVDVVDHKAQLSRITVVTLATPIIVTQIRAQLARLVPVREVVNLTEQGRFVEGSLAFIKLIGPEEVRAQGILVARKYGARIADTTENAVVFEITSALDKIERMIEQLGDLGPIEIARTGSVAMACGEAVLGASCQIEKVA